MNNTSEMVTSGPAGVTFKNTLPFDVLVYDSYGADKATSYVGDLTQLATVPAGGSALVQPKHPFASVFIVTHKDTGVPIARFVWLKSRPTSSFSVGQSEVDAINQTFAFIAFITKSPGDAVAKSFLAIIDETSPSTVDDVDKFFAKQPGYERVTFVTYMLGITATAQTTPPEAGPAPKPSYSLSRLVALMGGTWPSGFPDIVVQKYRVEDQDGSLTFWAEIDFEKLPTAGLGPISYFTSLFGSGKVLFNIVFHYGFDLGIFGTRLMLRFDDISIPLDGSTKLKVTKPTVSLDINPLFKFVVFGMKGTIPFDVFGQKFDALATFTLDNLEAAVGLVIQGDHASLPAPPQLRGLHFDEFGVGMGIFFEPPSYVVGLQGKFHIGEGKNVVALDDDTFAIVLQIEEEVPNPLYGSFYVPKLDIDTVVALFTDTKTGLDVPVHFTDLSFVWAENPLEPVVLPDGTLSQGALGFSAGVDVLSFSFYGNVRLDLSGGLTADVEVAPISLGEIFKLSGDGKGVTIKVDAQGSPIKNNMIRDKIALKDALANAKDKTLVPPGGPVLQIQTTKAPFLHLDAKASLFELVDYGIEADIDKSGIRFELDYGSVLSEKMKVTLSDFHDFDGEFTFGINRTISLPHVGPISLGSLPLKATISTKLAIQTSTKNVTFTVGGGFDFEGLHFTIPDFTVDVHISKISDLLAAIGKEIEDEAKKIFGAILGDAAKWAGWVAGKIITGIDDMAPVLKGAFNRTLTEATAIMKGARAAAEVVAKGVKDAYPATSADVAKAMKAAGYAANEVGRGVKQAFNLTEDGLASAMKSAGFIASDVGGALKSVFGGSVDDAAKALRAAGYGAEAVGSALKGTFTDSAAAAASALKYAGFGASEVGRALKGTFTSSAEEAAKALQAAGFAAGQIAGVAKDVFGATTQVAAQILNGLGVAGDAASSILSGIGYPASEIGSVLKGIFNWPPHINLPHVKFPHIKF